MTFPTLLEFITTWMALRHNNAIEPNSTVPAFDAPLVGCAVGSDPLFSFYKEDIGDFYWTPEQAFALGHTGIKRSPEDLSVIAWILPQTDQTRKAQRKAGPMPSIEWSRGRHFGEMVNEALRRAVVAFLAQKGVQSVAPALLPEWSRMTSERYGYASVWSERHTAYACGLGTFGLSDGLITPKGKAVRVGSVIVDARMKVTPRTYAKHTEWCLFHRGEPCLACAKRCPAGAISKDGHDKEKCRTYIRSVTAPYVEKEQLGFRVSSCGLCQTKVPCEFRNPTVRRCEDT